MAQYVDGRASHFYRGSSLIGYTNSTGDVNFYQFNAHGDVVSILDCFGNTVRSYDYDAFGKQKDVGDSFYRNQHGISIDDNPFRYCGEYFDDETGLIYLRARYYNPDTQRFMTEDSIRDGLNWYVYCGNNPVNFVDPCGCYYIVKESRYYVLRPSSEFDVIGKNIIDFLPFGSSINAFFADMFNVVGGNSDTFDEFGFEVLGEDCASNFFEKIESICDSKFLKGVSNIALVFSIAESLSTISQEMDIAYVDSIVFDYFEHNNISTRSTSKKGLENLMKRAYSFVKKYAYYFSATIDGKSTLYYYDQKIANSKNPTKTINKLVKNYEGLLYQIWNQYGHLDYDDIEIYVSNYRAVLKGYKDRIEGFNEAFLTEVSK